MKAKRYAVFFLFIFIGFTAAPSIIKMIKADTDTSVFFNLTEEENKSNPASPEKDFVFTVDAFADFFITNIRYTRVKFIYLTNYYPAIILNQHCPPPELRA